MPHHTTLRHTTPHTHTPAWGRWPPPPPSPSSHSLPSSQPPSQPGMSALLRVQGHSLCSWGQSATQSKVNNHSQQPQSTNTVNNHSQQTQSTNTQVHATVQSPRPHTLECAGQWRSPPAHIHTHTHTHTRTHAHTHTHTRTHTHTHTHMHAQQQRAVELTLKVISDRQRVHLM